MTSPAVIEHLHRYQMKKWELRAVTLAKAAAGPEWSSCLRDRVAAVVIDPQHWDVISVGFNDTAPGLANCGDGGCPRAFRDVAPGTSYADDEECIHAEDNALQRAGTRARGAWLVVTRTPCGTCYRRAKSAGVARIIVEEASSGTDSP